MADQTTLRQICAPLLEPADDFATINKAAEELYELLIRVSGLHWKKPGHAASIILPDGKAIGPFWAAMCIKDVYRTKKFLRGLYLAIRDMQERVPGQTIRVLYAGAGPFATLALPLSTVFTAEEVQFTLLEINPESIRTLQQVIDVFEVRAFFPEVLPCDAAAYRIDQEHPFHIILVEAMQAALQQEPQVALTLNLAPQMSEGGIFIPQRISIQAGLFDPKKDVERMLSLDGFDQEYYRILQTIFELDLASAGPFAAMLHQTGQLPEINVDIPFDPIPPFKQLSLFTDIHVYGTEYLTLGHCALNLPQKIMRLDQQKEPVGRVGFRYRVGEAPGFEWRVLDQ